MLNAVHRLPHDPSSLAGQETRDRLDKSDSCGAIRTLRKLRDPSMHFTITIPDRIDKTVSGTH